MDSYDLFGEDGTGGMLENLPELGAVHLDPAVTGDRNATAAYSQPIYSHQETPLQKLASFGSNTTSFSHMDPNNPQNVYTQGYGTPADGRPPMGPPGGAYGHPRQVPRPPVAPPTPNQYSYQPTADTMYSMSDMQQVPMNESNAMQAGWGQHYPAMHRYPQMSQYRQQPMAGYPEQKQQQFPGIMQQTHQTPYQIPQRHAPHPHGYPQAPSYPTTAPNQGYGGYMHQRMPHQYPQSHHQLDPMQSQQYGQMGHQSLPHPGSVPSTGHMGQGHSVPHPPQQQQQQQQQQPQPSTQNPIAQHPAAIVGYNQSHQQQQYGAKLPSQLGGNSSPQYRAPFPQLSPQISPRPQMSPRPQGPQVSPRPVVSPAKPNMSPHQQHPQMQQSNMSPRPAASLPSLPPKNAAPGPMPSYSQQSTLQALEQMVMPPSNTGMAEYPSYQSRNSLGLPQTPSMGNVMRNQQLSEQWPPPQSPRPHLTNLGGINIMDQVTNNASIPASQSLMPSQLPTSAAATLPNPVNMYGEDPPPTKQINEKIEEHRAMVEQNAQEISHNLPSRPQSEFPPIQSPTTSMPDKIPTSTTNVEPTHLPIGQPTVSHPSTPTPTSTTDDNLPNAIQEHNLQPLSRESGEPNMANSTSNPHTPTQSRSFDAGNFVRTTTPTYPGQNRPETPKGFKIDDLTQPSVFTYNQENSLSQESVAESNHSESSPNFQNLGYSFPKPAQEGEVKTTEEKSPSSPTQSHSLTSINASQVESNMVNLDQAVNSPSSTPQPPSARQVEPAVSLPSTEHNTTDLHSISNIMGNSNNQNSQDGLNNSFTETVASHSNQAPVPIGTTAPPTQQPSIPNQYPMVTPNVQNVQVSSNMPYEQHSYPRQVPHAGIPIMQNLNHMGIMPNQEINAYQPPISHQQERAALQQQLQELYCMPPAPELQEKIINLQEKLNILSQHEASDQCNGGSACILQSPMFSSSAMIDSPQVTSTTGRGRGKSAGKPRKPRSKKGEKGTYAEITQSPLTPQPQQLLPVSEDFVTPGAGLNSEMSEFTDFALEQVVEEKKRGRKPKDSKKPKERKKREAKDSPDQPRVKRKYVRKKKLLEEQDDGFLEESILKSADSSHDSFSHENRSSEEAEAKAEAGDEPESSTPEKILKSEEKDEPQEMQADSQTPADGPPLPESSDETKKDEYAFDESQVDEEIGEMPKKIKRPRAAPKKTVSAANKPRGRSGSKRGRKKAAQNESDGEGEDFITTPPPSPPEDDNSNKRRSARNTQRKKYIDDVMLRFSDDDAPPTPRSRKPLVPDKPILPIPTLGAQASSSSTPHETESEDLPSHGAGDSAKGMNYVYVNTTDDDSMVVQYVLASRMIKKEVKVEGVKKEEEDNEEEEEEKDKVKEEEKDGEDKDVVEEKVKEEEEEKTELVEIEEYFVKYRNFSYLHCEWKTEDELFKGDKRIGNKIKRFKQKQSQMLNIFETLDEEPFNPDYVEVDRVLDVSEHMDPATEETVRHYLVKWRSLQYEDCTWELEEDVDPIKIEQYEKFAKLPPKDKWKPKKRPAPEAWCKLDESPVYKGSNSLREYQLEGLNWLLFSWYNGRNCILADEMGLGKTIQSLTFIHSAWEYGIRGPFLVIAPLSTIPNWQREIESWTDMNVIVYHGSATSRNMIQEYEMYYKNDKGQHVRDLTKFNILITTFEIIVNDFADLKGFSWRLCVIDEAHRLKNRNCKLLEGLRQLSLEHRVLLSGTPLQNNVNELFSLLNFLEPTQFSKSDVFLKEFGSLKTEQEVHKLQCLLKPMMLRRLKEDVEKSLAPKEETVVEVELTNIQKKYYRGILERNFSFLTKGTTYSNIPNLMNTMMELRKCCIHPYLLNGAEDQIQYDFKQQNGEDPDAYYKALINSSGKMVLIDKLLAKLKAHGHRVLVFSQMVKCLDILEDYLMYRKYPYERIDGRIRGNLRQAAIDRFSKPDSDRFVFLLCTKAGGLGINLTAADTVIIYDSDWNPQNDLQAQARCHRIGQQKMVKIYRLLCRNTYEREMFDKASLKLGLDKAVLQSMNTSQGEKGSGHRQLSKKEIEDLLKKGAYGALLDEENDGDKFCEEDIDVILARRTQVITMESEKGSTFSKASFASSASRSDIDLDDPDFWNKWARKADIDTTEKDETEDLVIAEPRRRTQIKRYGHDESALDMSELESSSDSDPENDPMGLRSKRNKLRKKRLRGDDYYPREGEKGEMVYGSWSRRECFMVERGLLTFGWGRWTEILQNSQLRKGWREQDIEDCARVILLFCLRFYRGDEKIRNFIWDLIAPTEGGEQKISRNHQGLKDPVPRGIRNKHKRKPSKDTRHAALTDPNHWSKDEKYDGDIFLENNYKKHLGRHANKVLLRVRMLYYIKHEIIGDLVQHITDGVQASALPIYPPVTEQLPAPWWDSEFDKSLLIGTWKHGYENYTAMRQDPALCFLARCGPPSDKEILMHMQPATPSQGHNNEDDMDDEDTNEESSLKSRNRDNSEVNSEVAEPSPGPSACSESQQLEEGDMKDETGDDKTWPTITDLNTRLRRVITSYQRNYRKEEQKLQASKAKQQQQQQLEASTLSSLTSPLAALAQVSQQFDSRDPTAAMGLQGWDLQQLALYLLKMERQGKQALEQALKDSSKSYERPTISKRWTKREESDFFRVTSSFGIIYNRKTKKYDWSKFKQLAKLEKKSDEELTEYYKHFVIMCKKQTGTNVEDGSYDSTIEHINEEKARRTLERLELLSRIREEILTHPKLEERLQLCVTSADMPDWWVPGKHDRELLIGVAKYGLGKTDHCLLNDPEFSFHEILRKKVNSEPPESKDAIKLESHEDILKFDKDEILVKLEKGEGTLKIEKVIPKKEYIETEKKALPASEETAEKAEIKPGLTEEEEKDKDLKEEVKEESVVKETKEAPLAQTEAVPEEIKETEAPTTKEEVEEDVKKEPEPVKKEKEPSPKLSEEELSANKQAAQLKAMFPDLEVIQPLSRLSQVDTFVLKDKPASGQALDFSETTVAQLFNNVVKWPKEYAIQVRLQHIIFAVESNEWPAPKSFSAYATGIGNEFDVPIHELPNDPPKREVSTPDIDISLGKKMDKRKRHIAIDVETERAKLHALLNSSHMGASMKGQWEDDSEDSRRSTPQGSLQPPPAHQHRASSLSSMGMGMPFDFSSKYQSSMTPKTIGQTTVIPGTSSTLTPIDLSSGISKPQDKLSIDIQNEVQDFSIKKSSVSMGSSKAGTKLDDTLSKLMKRKNCPEPEPVIGKEKKRRKLDEIVLGLSAAKEQSLFPEPITKKQPVTPSVTVTPTSAPVTTSHGPSQKPFTITVTSVPSSSQSQSSRANNPLSGLLPGMSSKDSFSSFLAQAEQQNLLLKKQQQQQQQQQRKSYEAMIADIGSKVSNAYSHEAKVNKWLAEQNIALAEQPLGADYLSTRRRRPRVDPTLLDWKKLTGDENVSVVHRVTGKKLTGPKAPTLKRLGPWLMENPMYDIDPKWSELVKERGNLGSELHKRVQTSGSGLSGLSSSSVLAGSTKQKSASSGRPPVLSSPTGSTSSVSSASVVTSLPSNMSFPSLSNLNSSLLSGLSNLGQFDPKTNPLLMPFAGLPMSSMAGLGNLSNMNLFANLAGLGLPGLGGMDPAVLASATAAAASSAPKSSNTKSSSSSSNAKHAEKPQEAHASTKGSSSSSSSISTTNSFPFFFPNPSLLYTPLGLGGLNPFALQPGMSAYDSLGLLNGGGLGTQSSGKMKSGSAPSPRPSSSSTTTTSSSGMVSSSMKHQSRPSSKDAHSAALLLPPDTQILEGISKGLDMGMKDRGKFDKKEDKRKALESLRGMLPTDFTSKDKRTPSLPGLADITKLLEAQVTQVTKKSQEHLEKSPLEHLTKSNADLVAKALAEEKARLHMPTGLSSTPISTSKRARESVESDVSLEKVEEREEASAKKGKVEMGKEELAGGESEVQPTPGEPEVAEKGPPENEGVDIETLLPSSVVTSGSTPEKGESTETSEEIASADNASAAAEEITVSEAPTSKDEATKDGEGESADAAPKKSTKRRGKRKSGEILLDPEAVMEKKNLRSSASRSAAAAAARHQREAENAQKENSENAT